MCDRQLWGKSPGLPVTCLSRLMVADLFRLILGGGGIDKKMPQKIDSQVGFPFRILFLFRETRNKAKQKDCFAKFRLFRETQKNAKFRFVSFRFVSSMVKFRFVSKVFSGFVL
jgi:hypothetical protein